MIDDSTFECVNQRCDVVLSSCSVSGMPSLCWGMAGRLSDDRLHVEAWVREDQGRQFLADVRETGRVAAVFNEPYTNIAYQFKGRGARIRQATAEDAEFLRLHVSHMVTELARVFFTEAFARNFFEQPWSLLTVVHFPIEHSFSQTPGPRAGQALPARDAA